MNDLKQPVLDGKSQKIVTELYHLYALYEPEIDNSLKRCFSHFQYTHIYDYLKQENRLVFYDTETKNKFKELANLAIKQHFKGWIIVMKKTKDEVLVKYIYKILKEEFNKFCKSYLVRKQLYDMRRTEGIDMIIENVQTGKEIKMLEINLK